MRLYSTVRRRNISVLAALVLNALRYRTTQQRPFCACILSVLRKPPPIIDVAVIATQLTALDESRRVGLLARLLLHLAAATPDLLSHFLKLISGNYYQ
jgi:hypothetical protein